MTPKQASDFVETCLKYFSIHAEGLVPEFSERNMRRWARNLAVMRLEQ